jgi:monoamine oxidase
MLHAVRNPVGRIHWVRTEVSTGWAGDSEGALRSGIPAAKKVAQLRNA